MASIQTAIQITDRVSAPLNSLISAIDKTCTAFERMSTASDGAVDTAAISQARNALQAAVAQTQNLGNELENTGRKGNTAFDGMTGKLKGLIATYLSFKTVQGLVQMSDEMTSTNARLANMNAGFEKVGGAALDAAETTNLIYQAAQNARAPFNDLADVVARFGNNARDAFSGTQEVVDFATLVQKQMKIAGASSEEASNAILQLSQGLGSGTLRGDELNSIFEQAPNLIQNIADYMGVSIGKIRELASEGQITADIVKNAVFSASDDINSKFEQMPMTWGDVWTNMKNQAYIMLQPVLERINQLANNEQFQNMIDGLMRAFSVLTTIFFEIMEVAGMAATFISDNWGIIGPLFWGLVIAVGAYAAAMAISTAAQWAYNAALNACPIVWIILAIAALIAGIIFLINYLQEMGIITDTVFGLMVGCVYVAIAAFQNLGLFIANVALAIWNAIKALVTNMVIAFKNSIASIKGHFYDLLATAIDVVTQIANMLNKLPFVNIDVGGLTAAASAYRAKAQAAYDSKQDYVSVGEAMAQGFNTFAYKDIGDAWNNGKNRGNSIAESFSGKLDALKNGFSGAGAGGAGVGAGAGGAGAGGGGNVGKIANDTGKIANAVTTTNEELKYLRDIAERDIVNRFTTANITINQNNNNNVSSDMDIDGITTELTVGIQEAIAKATEGVHS